MNWLLIAAVSLGAALGALCRFGVQYLSTEWLGHGFPSGTLLLNVTGCFLAGWLYVYWQGSQADLLLKSAVMIGFLGSLTTFSAFSVDTMLLIQQTQWVKAGLNVAANMVLSIIAVFFGAWISGKLHSN